MEPYLLIDFGSTYTKVTAVDLAYPRLLGTAKALTTVNEGLLTGYERALDQLRQRTGEIKYVKKLACSSAAGGLKMVAIGLVPEMTVEAAKRAALGAGARVIGTFGFDLTGEEIREISCLKPDLILLAGGTDGGNRDCILHNGQALAKSSIGAPIIIAGNKTVAPEVNATLTAAGKECYLAPNVLPEIGRLEIEPVQKIIRELFLRRIIQAKGLNEVNKVIDGITMPTPSAALAAACRLAAGAEEKAGWGELLLVDVGGATTDVHSVAEGSPTQPQVMLRGLPEPRIKRTVEGDLGMRYSALALVECFSERVIAETVGLTEDEVMAGVSERAGKVNYLPTDEEALRLEEVLGYYAVKGAVERHVGRVEKFYTPYGLSYLQDGKDLTSLKTVIGTGGILVNTANSGRLLSGALFDPVRPEILKPVSPKLFIDQKYLFPTLGLIAEERPGEAFLLLEEALVEVAPGRPGGEEQGFGL